MSDSVNEGGIRRNSAAGVLAGPRQEASTRSLRDVYRVLFRHKRSIILFFVFVVIVDFVATFVLSPSYESKAALMVTLGRESVSVPPTAATGMVINAGSSEEWKNEINSEVEILSSEELVQKVVDSIGIEAFGSSAGEATTADTPAIRRAMAKLEQNVNSDLEKLRNLLVWLDLVEPISVRDRIVLKVMKKLKIEVVTDSSSIEITYADHTPKLAHDVVSKLIDFYLDKHIAVHRVPGSYEFFSRQTDELRTKLMQGEEELRKTEKETGLASLVEQRQALVTRMSALQEQTETTEAALSASNAKVRALQALLDNLPKTVTSANTSGFPNFAADGMRQQLYTLQLKEQDLLSKYAEGSDSVQEVRRQIAEATKVLGVEERTLAEVTTALNANYQQTELSLLMEKASNSSLAAQAEALRGQLESARKELGELIDNENRIVQLQREDDIATANYRMYSQRMEQARTDDALETEKISNISVVQPATLPIKPKWPKWLKVGLGLLLGIFGGIGIAYSLENLDHSVKTPEDVEEKLQLPTLGSIPSVPFEGASVTMRGIEPPSRSAPDGKPAKNGDAEWKLPQEVGASYGTIRDRLLQTCDGAKPVQVIAVASCYPLEGRSTVAVNLAFALASQADGRVLLVDADVCSPSLHQMLNGKLSPGLADGMKHGGDIGSLVVQPLPPKNLYLLSAGAADGDLLQTWDADQLQNLTAFLKSKYSFTVFDTPALSADASTIRLASMVDGVVLVIEAERVRWEVVQRAVQRLREAQANVLGVVLNKRRYVIPWFLYRRL